VNHSVSGSQPAARTCLPRSHALPGVSARLHFKTFAIHDGDHHIATILPKVSAAVAMPRKLCPCVAVLAALKEPRASPLRVRATLSHH
jgi:hypothetical protein